MFVKRHTLHACCRTPHGPHGIFVEADSSSISVCQNDFVFAIRQADANNAIVLTDRDSIHAIRARTRIFRETRFLDDAVLCTEEHIVTITELRIIQFLDMQAGVDGIVRINVQHILNRTPLGVLRAFWNFIHLEPETFSLCSKEKHRVVHGCRVDILDEILIARCASPTSNTAASLSAEISQRCPLDIAKMADGDDNFVVGIEVLRIKLLT